MEVHSIQMRNLCAELNQKVQEEKQRRKSLSKDEKRLLRAYRHDINERVVEAINERVTEKEKERVRAARAARAALTEFADLTIVMWDTRTPPSSIYEFEAASELPYSMKKWLH